MSSLTTVAGLVKAAPGIIHFACHNSFSATGGSMITFDGPWQPVDLSEAAQARTLAGGGPLVFLNACRSAGEVGWFAEMNGRLNELDRIVGAAFGAAAGRLNAHLRSTVGPRLSEVLGDVLVYQRHREEIQACVRTVIANVDLALGRDAEHPVDIVAHSLGGVIAVDRATAEEPLWIRTLVTFGSQAPLFHVCDPRGGALMPYEGAGLVRLPPSLAAWTNLWEPLDVVAFIAAKIFQLPDGSSPNDPAVAHLASSGLWTHSAYWDLVSVAEDITAALGTPVP